MNVGVIGGFGYSEDQIEPVIRTALETVEQDFGQHGDISYTLFSPSGFDPITYFARDVAREYRWETETWDLNFVDNDQKRIWPRDADEFLSDLDVILILGDDFPADITLEVAEELDLPTYLYE